MKWHSTVHFTETLSIRSFTFLIIHLLSVRYSSSLHISVFLAYLLARISTCCHLSRIISSTSYATIATSLYDLVFYLYLDFFGGVLYAPLLYFLYAVANNLTAKNQKRAWKEAEEANGHDNLLIFSDSVS